MMNIKNVACVEITQPAFVNLHPGDIMRWLLALPFIGLLWTPFYNQELPALFGFPFFYWYQLLWVPLTSLLIGIVYLNNKKKGDD